MEQRRQRRTLAARRDVGRAEIGDDVDPEPARQGGAVAQLPGAALGRAMQDRVAVKADEIDRGPLVACEKMFDRLAVEPGELGLDRGDRADPAQRPAQPLAKRVRIGDGQRRAGADAGAAVGLDQRHIDAVERGAAHQPERAAHPRPSLPAGGRGRWAREDVARRARYVR